MQLAHRRRTGAFRGDACDRSLGAVLVEAAFVTPLFLLLVFGIIEVGLAMNDRLALAHAVRAGTRVASASGNDRLADYGIIKTVMAEAAALGDDQIEMVIVYRADGIGDPPPDRCLEGRSARPTTKTDDACNVYLPEDFGVKKDKWGCKDEEDLDEFWCPMSREVVRSQGPEYVGVYMKVSHRWVTGMFGQTVTLTDQSVIRLEPRAR